MCLASGAFSHGRRWQEAVQLLAATLVWRMHWADWKNEHCHIPCAEVGLRCLAVQANQVKRPRVMLCFFCSFHVFAVTCW